MNILEISFILSEKIYKHDIARSLKEDYYIAEKNLGFDWLLLYNAAKYEHGYLKIPYGLEIVKANVNNEDTGIRESVERIIKNKEVNILNQNMIKFKNIINELVYSVHKPSILEESKLFTYVDLEREYRKYYADFLSLNLIQNLIICKSYPEIETAINKVNKIHEEIKFNFFGKKKFYIKLMK